MRAVMAALCAVLALSAPACGSDAEDLTLSHVHGLGLTSDTLFVATHFGLYAYTDGEWSRRSSDLADHMGFSLVSEDVMFRSGHPETGGNLGVQQSTDGGRTWTTASNVLDSPVDFHAMAASFSEPLVIYGWHQALFRSVGDPSEWELVRHSGLPGSAGALAISRDGAVYASTAEGLHVSEDRGDTWTQVSPDPVFFLATGGDALYASMGSEVLRSMDGGRSWTNLSDGLGTATIVALTASPDGRTVVAADQANAIWRSDNGGRAWTQVPPP